MTNEMIRIGFTWACQQAALWGWKWTYEGAMIWVKTSENEIGCDGRKDFIALVSEENKRRHS